jgi:hypothetical protein
MSPIRKLSLLLVALVATVVLPATTALASAATPAMSAHTAADTPWSKLSA